MSAEDVLLVFELSYKKWAIAGLAHERNASNWERLVLHDFLELK